MRRKALSAALVAVVLSLSLVAGEARAQDDGHAMMEPSEHVVSIYRIAPGQHVAFLEWMAEREAIAREAGAHPVHWFVHIDGDSWDFVQIGRVEDEAVEERIEAMTREAGLSTGAAAAMGIRRFVAEHTDTFSWGPTTAAKILEDVRDGM